MYDTEEIFFLTAAEYAILLAGKGVRRHYTMCLRTWHTPWATDAHFGAHNVSRHYAIQMDTEELGKKEICLAMNRLYQTGLIDSDTEQFFIQESLDGLLTTIKEAKQLFLVRFGREENRDFCCFVKGEKLTLLRISERDENSYEISKGSREALAAELEKSMETTESYEPVLEEEAYYNGLRSSRESISREMIRRFHNLLFSVEEIAPEEGSVKERLLVCLSEQGICCKGELDLNKIKHMVKEIVEKGEE